MPAFQSVSIKFTQKIMHIINVINRSIADTVKLNRYSGFQEDTSYWKPVKNWELKRYFDDNHGITNSTIKGTRR